MIDVLRDLKFEGRQLGAGRRGLRGRVAHVDVGRQARGAPLARQFQQILDGGEILLGNGKPRLRAAKLEIALRHVGKDGHQYCAPILDGDLHAGIGGFHRAAHAPEQVDLPGGIGAQLKLIVGIRNADGGAAGQPNVADRS